MTAPSCCLFLNITKMYCTFLSSLNSCQSSAVTHGWWFQHPCWQPYQVLLEDLGFWTVLDWLSRWQNPQMVFTLGMKWEGHFPLTSFLNSIRNLAAHISSTLTLLLTLQQCHLLLHRQHSDSADLSVVLYLHHPSSSNHLNSHDSVIHQPPTLQGTVWDLPPAALMTSKEPPESSQYRPLSQKHWKQQLSNHVFNRTTVFKQYYRITKPH